MSPVLDTVGNEDEREFYEEPFYVDIRDAFIEDEPVVDDPDAEWDESVGNQANELPQETVILTDPTVGEAELQRKQFCWPSGRNLATIYD